MGIHTTVIQSGSAADRRNGSLDIGRCENWPWLVPVFLLLAAGFAALIVDKPLARWMLDDNCPRFIVDILRHSETFAHGIGIAAILISIYVLDVQRRWALPRLAMLVILSGLSANLVKLIIQRDRPRAFDFSAGILDSFHGLLPLTSAGSHGQSTPSAHTAATIALALGLLWLYPRGRMLFAGLALLAAAQRIESGAHFFSDVFWGAALGWFVGVGILRRRNPNGWLACWESRRLAAFEASTEPATVNPPRPTIAPPSRAA